MTRRPAHATGVLLGALVLVALGVRLWGLTFGLPLVHARPDELLLVSNGVEFFTGDPNPHFFDYPSLYLYTIAGAYALYYGIGRMAGWFGSSADFVANFKPHYEPLFLIPRAMAAALGAATVAVVHAISATLFSRTAGLLSALFMALAFLHVRDSHYATTDVPMAFFTMCAMLAIVRVYQDRRAQDARLAGVLAGLAMGIKYKAVVLAVPMIVTEVLHAWPFRRDWRRVLRETHLWRMALPFILVFLASSPYLILDHQAALRDLRALQESTATGMTPPELLGRGWTYHLPYSLWYGLGWPLLFSGLGGMVLMAVRRPAVAAVLAAFPVAYYLIAGAGHNVFVRYMIPVVPFMCVFAGYLIAEAAEAFSRRTRVKAPLAAAMLGLVVVLPSAVSVVRFDSLLTVEDSRLVAGRWVKEHVPAGSRIYMSGNLYGHSDVEERVVPPRYRHLGFDRRAAVFTDAGQHTTEKPDWILVQRSEIPYSHIPPQVEQLLSREYRLAHTVRAAAEGAGNFYDIQDGFFVPFGGFRRVVRPGPNILIYRRRDGA